MLKRARLADPDLLYIADSAHVPYGNKPSEDIVDYTRGCVEELFGRKAKLALLGCNTATAVALRRLQQEWLPQSKWAGNHNILGIVAPTVEAATQTPWAVTSPQYPQKNNTDTIAVFGMARPSRPIAPMSFVWTAWITAPAARKSSALVKFDW